MWHCTRPVGGPQGRRNACYNGRNSGNEGAIMFESVEEVQQRFRDARYIASRRVSTVVFLAARMGRPVLIEGPAGVGKTELAKTLSDITSRPLIRLQCYEGLDEGKALYEWKYAKQLLYTQLVVLTSNNARELSDGLKRRCLHLFIDFPSPADELQIIRLKVPEIPDQLARAVVAAVQKIRAMDLRKLPSVSESLDWARSLVILNARVLDPGIVESTLTMLVKHEKDLERVRGSLDKVLAE